MGTSANKRPTAANSGRGNTMGRPDYTTGGPDVQAFQLLDHLHRGGVWGYWWTNPGRRSAWWPVGDPLPIPQGAHNVYFGVHPAEQCKASNERTTVQDVVAINGLFADHDAKDFDGDKAAALAHIDSQDPPPSVIVDSGGGYQAYWLLTDPYRLDTDAKRHRARSVQARWVALVGGDPGAKDLARVLRVPGTRNLKYDHRPVVTVIRADYGRLYSLDDLEALLPPIEEVPSKGGNGKATLKTFSHGDDVAAAARHLERLAPSRRDEYQAWVEVGMALSELGPTGLAMWQNWSSQSAKFKPGDCEAKWDGFTPGVGKTLASLHHWAEEDSPQVVTKRPAVASEPAGTEEKKKPLKRLMSREYHALYKKWGYAFRLNLCNDDVEVNGEPLSDTHTASIRQRIRDYGIENRRGVSVGATDDCIVTQAVASCYHPVKDYFEALRWDGEDHLARLLAHFTGDGYLDRWLDTWLPGAVARVYAGWQNPMLVLVGRPGVGKSYLAQWLCSPLPKLFIESPICPEFKDHRLRLIQNFIWEVQELGATTRKADQDALKAFITLHGVKERKSYGRRDMQKPAICSFIGTVNPDSGFLTDLTGNRRYIVAEIETIDWSYSEAVDIDQLWAQAVHVYRNGEAWKLTDEEQAQSERQNKEHLVIKPVQVYLERMYTVTDDDNDFVPVAEILSRLNTEAGIKPNTGTSREVASVLRSRGAVSTRAYGKRGVQERGYKRLKPLTRELGIRQ